MTRPSDTAGTLFAIPLASGGFSVAKALIFPEIAFFDLRLDRAEEVSGRLATAPVLFRICVDKAATSGKSGWTRIGQEALGPAERTPHPYRRRDALSGRLFRHQIVVAADGTRTFTDTAAEADAVRDLEAAAVWSRAHVEDRLNDHFAGRRNRWVEHLRLKSPGAAR